MKKMNFKDFLREKHNKTRTILDDYIPIQRASGSYDFDEWLKEIGVRKIISYANEWERICRTKYPKN